MKPSLPLPRLPVMVALLVGVPAAAHADLIFPSVVKCLSAAGPYSMLLVPAIVTLPLLFIISAIEALIARAVLKCKVGFGKALAGLFVVNVGTSAIGLGVMPQGTEILPGIPLAFLFTTLIEAPCLVPFYPREERRLRPEVFRASFLMNGASYALLCLILYSLIYLPAALMPDSLDKRELSGVVSLYEGRTKRSVAFSGTHAPVSAATEAGRSPRVSLIDGKRYLVDDTGKRIGAIPGGPYRDDWRLSDDGATYANYLWRSGDAVVGDASVGRQMRFRDVDSISVCRSTGKAALVIGGAVLVCDPRTGRTIRLRPHGMSSHPLVWSPDGRFLAYPAIASPYTQDMGDCYPDAIRVVSLDGREATVARGLSQTAAWDSVEWTAR